MNTSIVYVPLPRVSNGPMIPRRLSQRLRCQRSSADADHRMGASPCKLPVFRARSREYSRSFFLPVPSQTLRISPFGSRYAASAIHAFRDGVAYFLRSSHPFFTPVIMAKVNMPVEEVSGHASG